jgi:hypothetical protein
MSNLKAIKKAKFIFKPFSKKQLKVLSWWAEDSPTSDKFILVADGSVRSGKTIVCSLSFVLFVMDRFNGQNAALVGKSSGAIRRNVVNTLKQMLYSLNYEVIDHRADNFLEITKDDVTNLFYIFGAKDK